MSKAPSIGWFASGRIERGKLEGYLLSPTHPIGKHKARMWQSAFGFGRDDWQRLEASIRAQLVQGTPVPVSGGVVERWEIIIPRFVGKNGNRHPVKTAWALEPGRDKPHLTTAFPDL